jgi:hypothetical protein
MKSDLADFNGFGIQPEARRFDITAVTNDHIEQFLTVVLA